METTIETATAEEIVTDIQTGVFQQWLEGLIPKFWSFLWCVILALIVYFIGAKIIKLILKLFKKAMDRHDWDEGVELFIQSLLKYTLYIILFTVILGLFGITTTSISAAVAAMGVTVGLGLQGALANFAGGILILVMHPFRIGDYIIEGANGNEGTVVAINIIYTTLRKVDGCLIQIPNGTLADTSIVNCTAMNKRMFNETVGISYSADIKKAKEILYEIALATKTRVEDEDIKVFVKELGDSAVQIGLRFWISTDEFWDTKWATLEEIKKRFDAEGIEICFNQLDVHIDTITDIKK